MSSAPFWFIAAALFGMIKSKDGDSSPAFPFVLLCVAIGSLSLGIHIGEALIK